MADKFYGVNRGETEFAVVEDSASPTKDIEIVIDLAKSLTKSEVLILIDEIKNKITKGIWPPA